MTRSRRLLYSLVVFVAVFGVVELLSREAEARWFPYVRSIPLPAPAPEGETRDFKAQALKTQRALASGAIPLASDPERGWALTPDVIIQQNGWSIRTNSIGMRGPELAPKPEGTTRLFSLGDSSIFGDGVDEDHVFSAVAGRALAKAWGVPVDTVIGAIPGHTAPQSVESLRTYGARVGPDWVVIGNLWSDLYANFQHVSDQTYLPASATLRRLASYRLLWRSLGPWLEVRKVKWLASRDDVGSITEEGTPTRTSLPAYLTALREMVAMSRGLGANVVFLTLPAPLDFDVVPPPETVTAFRAAMATVAEESGAPLVDGPAVFHARGANIGYFDDQVHPNALGHALLGDAVAQAILSSPEGRRP